MFDYYRVGKTGNIHLIRHEWIILDTTKTLKVQFPDWVNARTFRKSEIYLFTDLEDAKLYSEKLVRKLINRAKITLKDLDDSLVELKTVDKSYFTENGQNSFFVSD